MTRQVKAKYVLLLFFPYLFAYFLIQSAITSGFNLSIFIDKEIPFLPEFVWVYHTLIPVFFLTTVIMIERRTVFFSALLSMAIASVVMVLFYVFFPAPYPRDGYTEASISGFLVELTRKIDGSCNTFPSSHVTFSWLLAFFAGLTTAAQQNRWIYPLYIFWAVLISISTVVLKQHFVLDVVSGIFLAAACYALGKNIVYERRFL